MTENNTHNINKTPFPAELDRFNWAAFLLNWIWGLGNRAPKALFSLIPIFGIFWTFKCGFSGNRWAWEAGHFQDIDSFKSTQRKWLIAALSIYTAMIVLAMSALFFLFYSLNQNEALKVNFEMAKNDPTVIEILGEPIQKGAFSTGEISTRNSTTVYAINYSISGPKKAGEGYIEAFWENGKLVTTLSLIYFADTDESLILVEGSEADRQRFKELWDKLTTKNKSDF